MIYKIYKKHSDINQINFQIIFCDVFIDYNLYQNGNNLIESFDWIIEYFSNLISQFQSQTIFQDIPKVIIQK